MKKTSRNQSKTGWDEVEVVAGNGLLDRRAFLRGGVALAGGEVAPIVLLELTDLGA